MHSDFDQIYSISFYANSNQHRDQHNLLQSYDDMTYKISEDYLYIFYRLFVLMHQIPVNDVSDTMDKFRNLLSNIWDIPVDRH